MTRCCNRQRSLPYIYVLFNICEPLTRTANNKIRDAMSHLDRPRFAFVVAIAAAFAMSAARAYAQVDAPPNSQPNPYQTVEGWAKMPEGRVWGSTSAVEIDHDG